MRGVAVVAAGSDNGRAALSRWRQPAAPDGSCEGQSWAVPWGNNCHELGSTRMQRRGYVAGVAGLLMILTLAVAFLDWLRARIRPVRFDPLSVFASDRPERDTGGNDDGQRG